MIDIRAFCKCFAIWIAVAVVIAVLGLGFGRVVEPTPAEKIDKWDVIGIFIIGFFEVFAYVLAPLYRHMVYDKKRLMG